VFETKARYGVLLAYSGAHGLSRYCDAHTHPIVTQVYSFGLISGTWFSAFGIKRAVSFPATCSPSRFGGPTMPVSATSLPEHYVGGLRFMPAVGLLYSHRFFIPRWVGIVIDINFRVGIVSILISPWKDMAGTKFGCVGESGTVNLE
jgi:hypothetical protein